MQTWKIIKEKEGVQTPISRDEWLSYLQIDKSLVRYVDTKAYIDSHSTFHDNDPYKQTVWRHPKNHELLDNLHFCIDNYAGLYVNVYIHNSKSVRKILQVASHFKAKVRDGANKIDQKYYNALLDEESGPKLKW